MTDKRGNYHHGNLRQTLLQHALDIIEQQDVNGLSMRLLAERIGVSRSALYHHFRNKEDLLAAIAEQGFKHMNQLVEHSLQQNHPSAEDCDQQMLAAVVGYLNFATEHAAQYDLMFSKGLWATETETPVQRYAKDCFRHFVALFEDLQKRHQISPSEPPLRLAQIFWSSLHGLAKLMHEDILTAQADRDILARHLVNRFV